MPMPKRFIRRPAVASMLLIVVAALGACASTPAPVQQLAVAEAAVQHANTASTQADAPRALRVAVDKLAAANRALAAGDRDRARVLAEQADVDAQVAEIQAQARRSETAARETQDAARVLREEMDRKAPR